MSLIRAPKHGKKTNLLIIGAGVAGDLISKYISENQQLNYNIVGFVDDDLQKMGGFLRDFPIFGPIDALRDIAKKTDADELLIAMPSATGETIKKIARRAMDSDLDVKILPSSFENVSILKKKIAGYEDVRPLEIEDFFRRAPVIFDLEKIEDFFKDKKILVTGGAGSIGSQLCRQLLEFGPDMVIAFDNSESALHDLTLSMKKNKNFLSVLGDIKDRNKLRNTFSRYLPDIIFHTAAYKHVPMVESNPDEAIKNNVFGTKNVIDIAEESGVKDFILISTDKAVNPTSLMGASKRMTEMLIQDKKSSTQTRFFAVRFGNVINSRGSVIPLFKEQIRKGGPMTVTHPEIRRFFMTIPEAVHLIIQAPLFAESGDIFVLDMGEQIKITDLAEELIRLEGFKPHRDIKIDFIGLREGEKLFEELSSKDEAFEKTENSRINLVKTNGFDKEKLDDCLKRLHEYSEKADFDMIREEFKKAIPNFSDENGL